MQLTKDEKKIKEFFQTIDADLLIKVMEDKIDIEAVTRTELADRGLDRTGSWIGFDAAKKVWEV